MIYQFETEKEIIRCNDCACIGFSEMYNKYFCGLKTMRKITRNGECLKPSWCPLKEVQNG